jgi:hypothetical protein
MFKPHADEIYGLKKMSVLLRTFRRQQCIEIHKKAVPRLVTGQLNCVFCNEFTFEGLHEHRVAIRKRLVEICADINGEPNWGRGGFIGVHVRLTEFKTPSSMQSIETSEPNTRIPIQWYVDVIDQLRAGYPELAIKVFSDGSDIELNQILRRGAVRNRARNDIRELLDLSSASILVGSNSTYSRWAAFLGDMRSIWIRTNAQQEKPTSQLTPIEYVSALKPVVDCNGVYV